MLLLEIPSTRLPCCPIDYHPGSYISTLYHSFSFNCWSLWTRMKPIFVQSVSIVTTMHRPFTSVHFDCRGSDDDLPKKRGEVMPKFFKILSVHHLDTFESKGWLSSAFDHRILHLNDFHMALYVWDRLQMRFNMVESIFRTSFCLTWCAYSRDYYRDSGRVG